MNRYNRQISLPELGEAGQEKLRQAKVLIVGVGGLGSPIALYLAGAGVGTLGLVDNDLVSLSNLQRQVLYTEAQVGQPKVHCAAQRLQALNSDIRVEAYPLRLDSTNVHQLIAPYDIVVDGCDNFATRYLLSDACTACGKPYVYGAIQGFEGQVSVLCHGPSPKSYRDLYPNLCRDEAVALHTLSLSPLSGEIAALRTHSSSLDKTAALPAPSSSPDETAALRTPSSSPDKTVALSMPLPDNSVIGITPAVVGSIQAGEVLKLIGGYGETLSGKLWTIDLRTLQSHILSI